MTVPAYTLTDDELRSLVREEIRAALAERAPSAGALSEVLTREQAAAMLHVNPHQIPKLIKRGLPAHRMGTRWRFRRSEILGWLESRNGVE